MTHGLLPFNRQKALTTVNMDFCGVYDKQLSKQPQPVFTTPLWGGWEFRPKPDLLAGTAGWMALAKSHDWDLPAAIRHDLLSGDWAVVVTDLQQIIQYVNPQFERMTGYGSHETVGRRPDFLQGTSTDPVSKQRIRKGLERKKIVIERVLNYRKNQDAYWCHIVIRPIVNRQKQIVNFIAFEQETEFDESVIGH
ncbi:PAS domain-containing protein [Spirosoma agri]|nr:PAS domain-containing protein [Spirosoma agri]